MPGVVLARRIDYYRVVIGIGACGVSVPTSKIEKKGAFHAQGQVWYVLGLQAKLGISYGCLDMPRKSLDPTKQFWLEPASGIMYNPSYQLESMVE